MAESKIHKVRKIWDEKSFDGKHFVQKFCPKFIPLQIFPFCNQMKSADSVEIMYIKHFRKTVEIFCSIVYNTPFRK